MILNSLMRISDFDYKLPKDLIAQHPVKRRDTSKLLVYHKRTKKIEHVVFKEITKFMKKGDCLVVNESKVVKSRIMGRKETGGKCEIILIEKISESMYKCLLRTKKPRIGINILLNGMNASIVKKDNYYFIVKFDGDIEEYVKKYGNYAIPPYIKRMPRDSERYQTIFANKNGSIASPTAGLHFSKNILNKIEKMGVSIARICLHVSTGTFMQIRSDDYRNHKMDEEYFEISKEEAIKINNAKRLWVVGTTSLRAIESAFKEGNVRAMSGKTNLFIYPGYVFKNKIYGFITNFHLPRSTMLLLVAAMIGRKKLLEIYNIAIKMKYRFYSFGDAMLIIND